MTRSRRAWLPPRWFVVLFWHGHRAVLRVTRGRLGLWRPKPNRRGAMRLTTTGRRTGGPRQVVGGYFEDGRNLVTMAMNGWGAAEPAWWLNLHPRRITTGPCASRRGRRARAVVVPLGRDRRQPRRLRRAATNRDRRGRIRATRHRRPRRLILPSERIAEAGRGLRSVRCLGRGHRRCGASSASRLGARRTARRCFQRWRFVFVSWPLARCFA